jgi:hypothetical protein
MRITSHRRVKLGVLAFSFILACPILYNIIYKMPVTVSEFGSSSIRAQCASIHARMPAGEVIETFNRTSAVLEQSLSARRAVFSTTAGACYVEFDDDGLVSRAEMGRPLWQY